MIFRIVCAEALKGILAGIRFRDVQDFEFSCIASVPTVSSSFKDGGDLWSSLFNVYESKKSDYAVIMLFLYHCLCNFAI